MGGSSSSLAPCGANGTQMTWRTGNHSSWRPGHEDSATSQSSILHHHQGFFTTKPSSLGSSVDSLTPLVTTSTSTMPSTTTTASRSKLFGLATLRRKVMAIPSKMRKAAGGLGRSQSREHARTIRALLSGWSVHEIHALVEEYETLMTIRDLTIEAEIARHVAPSVSEDLARLFDLKICTDTELVFKSHVFPVHRAVLSARCPYFRDLFSSSSSSPYVIPLTPHLVDLNVSLFASLLRFLYCGEFKLDDVAATAAGEDDTGASSSSKVAAAGDEVDMALLGRLAGEFGTPNPLELDLLSLYGHGVNSDAMLVFTSSCESSSTLSPSSLGGFSTEDLGVSGGGGGGGVRSRGASSPPPPSRLTTSAPSTPTQPKFFLNLQSPPLSPTANRSNVASPNGGGESSSAATSPMGGATPAPLIAQPIALLCHRAILSIRSPFFKSIIQRRLNAKEEAGENSDILQIVLDEKVIPRKYASIIMEAIYTDKVDLSKISSTTPASGCNHVSSVVHPSNLGGGVGGGGGGGSNGVVSNSLKEAAAISTGKGQHSSLDDAMELYQIGQFIDLEILSQRCEDIIVSHLSLDNILKILSWSSEPHGSTWVKRQCLRFLREEFAAVVNCSPPTTLVELSEADMTTLLASDFLQASEQDILGAVLKWSEHQLVRRVEEREPNLVSGTTHSVTRRGLRRRDVNDAELRDIASPLMTLVRLAHVLPPNSETLHLAQRRGLLASPPAHLFGPDSGSSPPQPQTPYHYAGPVSAAASSPGGGSYAPAAGVFTGSFHPHQHPHHAQQQQQYHYGHHHHPHQGYPQSGGPQHEVAGDFVPSAAASSARLHSTMNVMTPRCYGGGNNNGRGGPSTTHHAKTTPPNHPNNAAATNALSSSSAAWLTRFPRFPPSSSSSSGGGGGPAGGRGTVAGAFPQPHVSPSIDGATPLKPRLFFPYFEEAKAVLQEQLVDLQEDLEVVRLRMLRCCMSHHFPDTLYMVSPTMMANHDATNSIDSNTLNRMDPCEPGVVANSELFIPDCDVMLKLLNRMMRLTLHPLTQRALSMLSGSVGNGVPCGNASAPAAAVTSGAASVESTSGRNAVFNLLQLRAIREAGLPDQVIHVLKTPALYYPDDVKVLDATKQLNSIISTPNRRGGPPGWGSMAPASSSTDSRPLSSSCDSRSRVPSGGGGGVDFLPAGVGRTSYIDAAHASISPSSSSSSCPEKVPPDFPASLLDPWSGPVDDAVEHAGDLPAADDDPHSQCHHHHHQHHHYCRHQQQKHHQSTSTTTMTPTPLIIECEDDINGLEGAVGGVDLFNYGAVPDLTMGTLPSSRPSSIEVVSTGTSMSPGPSSPEQETQPPQQQQQTGHNTSHGSMNRFHITHFGGLMPPSTSPNESPREEATNDPVARPAVHQAKDQKETTGCDSTSDSSLSLPLPFYHPTPVFLPVTPQAPVSPRHQFHHHQHTCNHHANPNLLIPSSNCLSKMNWAAGSDPSSTVASGVPCPRSASSSSGLMRFPPDIAVGAHPAAVAAAAATSPPQLLSPTSPLQPPPLDILPSSYHSHALRQNNAPTSAGAAADTHNRPPCPYPDYDVSASTTTASSSQMKAASANSSSSGCPATCNGGSAAAASVSDEQLPVSFEQQQQQQQQHPNHRGRGRSRQRRERGSLGSPTDGVVGAAIGAAAVQQQHFFERTSVSLVRRAPSQRRHNEVEEDVSIDDEGLFV